MVQEIPDYLKIVPEIQDMENSLRNTRVAKYGARNILLLLMWARTTRLVKYGARNTKLHFKLC